MFEPLKDMKQTPTACADVLELEQHDGSRTLTPTHEWTESLSKNQELAQSLSAFYITMGILGLPAHLILTVAAIRFADEHKKINIDEWLESRSGWTQEDKDATKMMIKMADIAKLGGGGIKVDSVQVLSGDDAKEFFAKEYSPKKSPGDDWNIN